MKYRNYLKPRIFTLCLHWIYRIDDFYYLVQESENAFCKGQRVDALGFAGSTASVQFLGSATVVKKQPRQYSSR